MVSDNFVEQAHRELYDALQLLDNRSPYQIEMIGDETLEQFRDRVEALGFFSGANAAALVFKSWVLKWTREDESYHSESGSANDEELYWRVANKFPQYLENFAMSQALDSMFTLQERIIPSHDIVDYYSICDQSKPRNGPSYEKLMEANKRLIDISFDLGIGDLHSGNWGYRVDDVNFDTPVIFDFSRTGFDPVEYGTSGREIMSAINISTYGEKNRKDIIKYIEAKYGEPTEEQMMEGEDEKEEFPVKTADCSCSFCKFDRNEASIGQSEESLF